LFSFTLDEIEVEQFALPNPWFRLSRQIAEKQKSNPNTARIAFV